ncbi:hypothetical protein BD779DRAFT_1476274 [Infundibulicybe gibba]|nr:hypothetical protein BD779DRAFT_1476274 [Infundibulicybe gibba]
MISRRATKSSLTAQHATTSGIAVGTPSGPGFHHVLTTAQGMPLPQTVAKPLPAIKLHTRPPPTTTYHRPLAIGFRIAVQISLVAKTQERACIPWQPAWPLDVRSKHVTTLPGLRRSFKAEPCLTFDVRALGFSLLTAGHSLAPLNLANPDRPKI